MEKGKVFERKNILIIGGAGFIGTHLCEKMLKNHNVICIDNFITSETGNITQLLRNPNFVFVKHDITEPIDLETLPELEKFSVPIAGIAEVYNFACPMSPKNFENFILETALTNSVGTKNALDIAVKYQSKFLQASSSVVYGGASEGGHIFKEDDKGSVNPVGKRACYDEGKRFAETLVDTYHNKYKIDTKIARIFRTYGPRMRLNDGQMIPDFITNAIDNKDLIIFGDESFSSSFCYISDVIEGMLKLMETDINEPVNLGSPDNYLISDVAGQIIDMVQSSSKVVFQDPLLFMRPLGLPDISKAKEGFGWFPIVTINEGLKRTIEYAIAEKGLIKFGA